MCSVNFALYSTLGILLVYLYFNVFSDEMVNDTTDLLTLLVHPFPVVVLSTQLAHQFNHSAPWVTLFARIAEGDIGFARRTQASARTQFALREPGSPRSPTADRVYRSLLTEPDPEDGVPSPRTTTAPGQRPSSS